REPEPTVELEVQEKLDRPVIDLLGLCTCSDDRTDRPYAQCGQREHGDRPTQQYAAAVWWPLGALLPEQMKDVIGDQQMHSGCRDRHRAVALDRETDQHNVHRSLYPYQGPACTPIDVAATAIMQHHEHHAYEHPAEHCRV